MSYNQEMLIWYSAILRTKLPVMFVFVNEEIFTVDLKVNLEFFHFEKTEF